MRKIYSNKRVILTLILPGLLTFLLAILAPICLSIYYSFTDFSGMGEAVFNGLDNYKAMFQDTGFWVSLRNSLLLAIGFICIQHPLALITAAILDKMQNKAEGFFRCVYFIPNVISVAVIAYLWKFIYNPNFGLLNNILKNIDPVLYEAAAIDGATGKEAFMKITLPLMKPVIQVNVTMAVISALKQMETVYLLTNGGPGDQTQFMANYLYKQAFNSFKYGYGNTISVAFIVICLLATVLLNRIFKEKDA